MAKHGECNPHPPNNGLNGLSQHKDILVEILDPDFGLLDKLLGCGALSKRQINTIKTRATLQERNEELLEHIANNHDFTQFFVALSEAKQGHVVKYLEENGNYKPEYCGNWPLMDAQTRLFDVNQECLIDLLETCDLIPKLVAEEVISNRQKDFIAAKITQYEKNEALLDILRRRNLRDYWMTVDCLKRTNQAHIAEIFEREAVVVSAHANLSEDVADVVQVEEEIASQIAALLKDKSKEESQKILGDILSKVDVKLIGAKTGNSVVLYFLCLESMELCRLHASWKSGVLACLVERLFNRLLSGRARFEVTVSWEDKDYARSKDFLEGREHQSQSLSSRSEKLVILPLELLDMILGSVCLQLMTLSQSCRSGDKEIFMNLASVDTCWHQRLRKQRFKAVLFRRLSAYHRNTCKRTIIIRNNREYLSEILQPKGLLKSLRFGDCLTDLQLRSLTRNNLVKTRNEELVNILPRLNGEQFSVFTECTRRSDLETMARLLENGGVTIKAVLRNEPIPNQSIAEEQFADRFKAFCRKTCPMSRQVEIHFKRPTTEGIEFINASYDNNIALWVHCRCSEKLSELREASGMKKLTEDISELFRQITLTDAKRWPNVKPTHTAIDACDLHREVAVISNCVKSAAHLRLTADYLYGITKLDNRIYILCQSPNTISVFHDKLPFDLIENIPIEDIKRPEDIGASQKNLCLYITDSGNKCVWQKHGERLTIWLANVDWPFTLSVSRDGQVLLPRKGEPSHVELYTGAGVLVQRITLPSDIIDPLHGVLTREGNLVASHWWRDSVTEGVCELNLDGKVVRRFLATSKDQELTYPRYLTLDNDDRLFVTDFDNNRLIQLDSNLSWIRVLLNKEEDAIEYPERLYYDEKKKQLLIGHIKGVDVFVLQIS